MKISNCIIICLGIIPLLVSCSGRYYTKDDFSKIVKIDSHTHCNSVSPGMVELAKEDNFRLLHVNVDAPGTESLEKQFEFASAQHQQYPDRVDFLTAFSLTNWDSANWASQTIAKLKSDFAAGSLGVKVWKNIGMVFKDKSNQFVMIDNPKFDPVIDFIIQQDKTVLGHLGEPRNCWLPYEKMTVNSDKEYFKAHPEYHMYLHPEYPSYEDQINARDRFLERHPNLRFVGAHLGSLEWSVDELAKRLDKFPNMAVDMAERICHLQFQSRIDREKVRNFVIKYQDRLIYGTDFEIDSNRNIAIAKKHWHDTWLADWNYFVTNETMTAKQFDGEFKGLQLPREVVDKIYRHNAVHWYKINNKDN